jgi:hypothetical protein
MGNQLTDKVIFINESCYYKSVKILIMGDWKDL